MEFMGDDSEWIFPLEQLSDSPSRRDGISEETEKTYREMGCTFIHDFGRAMQSRGIVIATACVFFNRFFALESFKVHDYQFMAVAALQLPIAELHTASCCIGTCICIS